VSATNTATVETLTAEVRVLMVGKRQVTLSVYRQLDTVDLPLMEPFGRVRDSHDGHETWVVGRRLETSELVKACCNSMAWRVPEIWAESLTRDITVCYYEHPRGGFYRLQLRGREIKVDEDAAEKCGKHGYVDGALKDGRCTGWRTNGLDDEIAKAIEASDHTLQQHRTAERLPLIVLAGLR
jgi:hypothetical protein